MNIDFIDGMIMPIITAACLCIGFATKDDFDALREEFVHLKERVEALGKE